MTDHAVKMISTFFYTGRFPVAPGTFASAAAALAAIILMPVPVLYILFFVVMTALGFLVSGRMEELEGKKDPGCVVIDEVAGIGITYLFLPLRWDIVLIGFFLFRAFDMFKIYPANYFEAKGGGFGIMMDDVIAGIYTNCVLQIAIRWAGII